MASGEIDKNGNSTDSAAAADGPGQARQKDPARELAHALHMLKAYADNSSDASGTSDGNATGSAAGSTTGSISVEA